MKLAKLVSSFEESATLALAGRAKKLAAEGRSIINFGVGEPDFVTDAVLIERAHDAALKGQTKYTPVPGTLNLRKAIASRIEKDYGFRFETEEVLTSSGGKQAIYHFLQAVVDPGDEVIVLSPYWVSFPEMVKMVGGKPVIVRSADGPHGRILARDIASALTDRTKAIILNSPSNPSGFVMTKDELKEILDLLGRRDLWILSDDTYYSLCYTSEPWTSVPQLRPDLKDRFCVVGSASKSYAMTGWRLGWALGPKALIDAMAKLQSQVTSHACSLTQAAVEAAVTTEHDRLVNSYRSRFKERRDRMVARLGKIPQMAWLKPDGAFYVFIDVGDLMKPGRRVSQFAVDLLENHGVCAIPGEAFGEANFLRLSYALGEAQIDEGLERLEKALKS